jgi:hypothetical protein
MDLTREMFFLSQLQTIKNLDKIKTCKLTYAFLYTTEFQTQRPVSMTGTDPIEETKVLSRPFVGQGRRVVSG